MHENPGSGNKENRDRVKQIEQDLQATKDEISDLIRHLDLGLSQLTDSVHRKVAQLSKELRESMKERHDLQLQVLFKELDDRFEQFRFARDEHNFSQVLQIRGFESSLQSPGHKALSEPLIEARCESPLSAIERNNRVEDLVAKMEAQCSGVQESFEKFKREQMKINSNLCMLHCIA